ncbi:acyloxyacyl hydrolase [Hyunsoonleella flava]|uniref:Acyloxyacyl hydrolase n=1 Tax=Hyunsoonleella flava TaxID=2527939 RepID=A0A4Q9FES0_9FLAO|nr:acyloxyacyl hydrolase [Hyunsoonleella flava]TBN02662.1 acyloxyacyl hydrolase [Hyunsoonleella flava]
MKLIYTCVLVLFCFSGFAQNKKHTSYIDLNNFKGYIALHNNEILHLIQEHPQGFILSWNKKTYGFEDWEQRFNYPDYGFSFAYQNFNNDVLGNNVSVYVHYNFYFLNRNLMFRIGQGLAHNSNPYDRETNFKNVAFGSTLMSSTYAMINYKRERIFDRFGLQAGFSLMHYSNANFRAPNNGTNTIAFNIGMTYNLDEKELEYQDTLDRVADKKFTEPIKYNVVFRSGLNESDLIGSGQFPFYVFSGYADKRLNRKSALQVGADVFFSNFLKELIRYRSVAFPDENLSGEEDFKRVGVFVGHELFVNKTSLLSQLGYYVYYPFEFEGRVYIRAGLKRYFGKKWFGALTLKSHGFRAEAVEFGVGIRL